MSVGMAIAEAAMAARYGAELVDHHTYVICGDGCLMEGVSHEAIDLAGHLGLSKLIVMWDDNRITIDGKTNRPPANQRARFEAAGGTRSGSTVTIRRRSRRRCEARAQKRPTMIACRTTIGFGAPSKQGSESTHGAPLGAAETEATRKNLNWPYPPFEIPGDMSRRLARRRRPSRDVRADWEARLAASPKPQRSAARTARIPADFAERMGAFKARLAANAPTSRPANPPR